MPPRILGPDGQPVAVPARDLARRLAPPAPLGLRRTQQWQAVAPRLTPWRLRQIEAAVAQGTWCPEFFELAEELEERDLHYRGVLQQRRLRSAGAPLDVVPASAARADIALAAEIREQVVEGPGFHNVLLDLLDALGKGIACVEVVWEVRGGRWRPAHYHRIDPRWLVVADDGETPGLLADRTDRLPAAPLGGGAGALAAPLLPGKFVVHRHRAKSGLAMRGGLAYAVAAVALLKSVAVRDWWAYGEMFGLPVRVGTYNAQTATDTDIETLTAAVAALAADAGCVIPDSMAIDVQSPGTGGGSGGSSALFPAQAAWCDQQISKAVVGATMTADDGASRSQAEVHLAVREDLVRDDVRQLAATLSETLIAWYSALNHAPRPAGWPRLALPETPNPTLTDILAASAGGLPVPTAWLHARVGIPEPAEGAAVLRGGSSPAAAVDDASTRRAPLSGPGAPRGGLHAADPGAWTALVEDLTEPLAAALAAAETPEAVLEAAADAALPDALAADLAQRLFAARVDGEDA